MKKILFAFVSLSFLFLAATETLKAGGGSSGGSSGGRGFFSRGSSGGSSGGRVFSSRGSSGGWHSSGGSSGGWHSRGGSSGGSSGGWHSSGGSSRGYGTTTTSGDSEVDSTDSIQVEPEPTTGGPTSAPQNEASVLAPKTNETATRTRSRTFNSPGHAKRAQPDRAHQVVRIQSAPRQFQSGTQLSQGNLRYDRGRLRLSVPEDAVVYLQGRKRLLSGATRRYDSSRMARGEKVTYALRVEVTRDGTLVSQSTEVVMEAGKQVVLTASFDERTGEILFSDGHSDLVASNTENSLRR